MRLNLKKMEMTRLDWVLSLLLLLLILTLGALLLFVRGEETSPEAQAPLATWSFAPSTASGAYDMATPLAQRWANDARLLQARSDWPPGTYAPEHSKWTFQFYSAQREEVAVIAVSGNAASLVKSSALRGDVQVADVARWQVDSDEVVQKAMQEGGQDFIAEHDQAEMVLILKAQEELRWTAVLVDAAAQSTFRMELDAASGKVTGLSRPYDD